MNAKPKRRWYQFSLKTLILLLTLICLGPGGIVAYEQNRARRQQAAIVLIEKSGGQVAFDRVPGRSPLLRVVLGDDRFARAISIYLRPPETQQCIPSLRLFPRLMSLYVSHCTDDDLAHLAGLKELSWLDLRETEVTSKGLVHLAGLTKLEVLQFYRTGVDDAGVAHLGNLHKLSLLDLGRTQVSDACLSPLSKLNSLERLYLAHTSITDAGIATLVDFRRLNYVDLTGTLVTDDGVANLRRSMPDLQIDRARRWSNDG